MNDNHALIAKYMSEKELQANVIEMAERLGWLTYHTFDSRRSNKGFPDLVMAKVKTVIFAELKTERGKMRPEQERWEGELRSVEELGMYEARYEEYAAWERPVQYHLWRPSNWLDGTIQSVLEEA